MATYGIRLENTVSGFKTILKKGLSKEEATQMKNDMNKKAEEAGLTDVKVVRFIEMNQHEKVINHLIQNCISELIGGLENQMMDNEEGSEEYEEAKAMLNHDMLFDAFYSDIMAETKRNAKSHLRFAGKGFIEDRIEKALERNGYGK